MMPAISNFQAKALARAAYLKVPAEAINEAVGTLTVLFGDRWLSEACARDLGSGLPLSRHPIGNLLLPPGDYQIAGLLELVEYMKFAAHSSALGSLIDGLKAHYGHTFLQLAFGYRFHRAGATDVEFEPPVQRGLSGDIDFIVDGRRMIAECYIPRVANRSTEANWLVTQCLELRSGEHTCVLAVSIKFKRPSLPI